MTGAASYRTASVSEARPVRIARSTAPPRGGVAGRPVRAERASPPPPPTGTLNTAASRRAYRLGLLFVLVVAIAYYLFVVAGSYSPGGGSVSERIDLAFLGGLAACFAAGGFLFTLAAAPRSVEIGPSGWTLHLRPWGQKEYSTARGMRVRRLQTVREGLFTPAPIVYVELSEGKLRRTYWVDESILPEELATPF
jgi:hypothetical protein